MGAKGHLAAIRFSDFERLLRDWGFEPEGNPGGSGRLRYNHPIAGCLVVHQPGRNKVLNHNHGLVREAARGLGVSVRQFIAKDFDAADAGPDHIGLVLPKPENRISRDLRDLEDTMDRVKAVGRGDTAAGFKAMADTHVDGVLKPRDGNGHAPEPEEDDMASERVLPGQAVQEFLQAYEGEWQSIGTICDGTGLKQDQVRNAVHLLSNRPETNVRGGAAQGLRGMYMYEAEAHEPEPLLPEPEPPRDPEVIALEEAGPQPPTVVQAEAPRRDLAEQQARSMPALTGEKAPQALDDILDFYGDRTVIHHDDTQTILMDPEGNLWRVVRQRYVPG